MTQKITLLLKSNNIRFAKKAAKEKGTSMSRIVDDYLDLLQRIEKRAAKEKLHPFVKKFGGMLDTGKNEDVKSIFNI